MKNTLLILYIGILFAVGTVINVNADNGGTDVGSGILNAKVIKPLKMTVHPEPPEPSLYGFVIPQGTTRVLPPNYVEFQILGENNAGISLDNTNVNHNLTGLSVTVYWGKSKNYGLPNDPAAWPPFVTTDALSSNGRYYVRVFFLTATTTSDAVLGSQIIPQTLTVQYTY